MSGFWVYENWRAHGHRATVHRSDCRSCNSGAGVHGGTLTPNGKWHGPYQSLDEARSAASRDAKLRECRRCHPAATVATS
jgi:hypothetical protein